jgi:hypothetical protein
MCHSSVKYRNSGKEATRENILNKNTEFKSDVSYSSKAAALLYCTVAWKHVTV